jgi:hypothetical protein
LACRIHAHGGPQFLVGGAHPRHLGFHPPLARGQRFAVALDVVQRAQRGTGRLVQRVHELDDGRIEMLLRAQEAGDEAPHPVEGAVLERSAGGRRPAEQPVPVQAIDQLR